MVATAGAEDYRRAIEAVGRAGVADAIIVIFVPPLVTEAADVAPAIVRAAERIPDEITLATVFMAGDTSGIEMRRAGASIPVYAFPEDAARALGHAAGYGAWRQAPTGRFPLFADCRADEAAAVIARALARGPGWLPPEDVGALLDAYGLRAPASRLVTTADEAGRAAADIGGAVALKAIAPGLLHKSDLGGVAIGLAPEEVEPAAAAMAATLTQGGFAPTSFLVQAMAPSGVELIVGVVGDRTFGPLVACGAGGTTTELLGDVAVRLTPLSDLDAREMLRSMRLFPLLDGYRGAPPCDIPALEELLLRVSALVEAHPEVVEMDLNPVIALSSGALIVDARIRIEQAAPVPPRPSLRS
jgi:acyl-CoA synthetase (NDP forming)